ncbi:flagellar assembly protein FliW [Oceanobacillus halotolerans]|uniref:flagellar assembly protein FliW n=1 Tax=Oceanobacillus halotolerans TaxID=2663380 RepID=UPI0013DC1A6D|nr:flagellar assembly protein FliW [Oceanobacillus halotolerans]
MNVQTKYLGELTIDREKVIQFPTGLPGFIEETKFVLLDLPENPVFQVLQSIHTKDVAFIVTNPYHFYQSYTFELDDSIIDPLAIKDSKDVVVLSIVTLKQPFENSTLNLKAPIIINAANQFGKQYILNIDDYPSKASIAPKVKGES